MNNEKVVVVLLLVTIILSILSVVVTLAVPRGEAASDNTTVVQTGDPDGTASVQFTIGQSPTAGAG